MCECRWASRSRWISSFSSRKCDSDTPLNIQSPPECDGCSLLWQNRMFLVDTVCVGWEKRADSYYFPGTAWLWPCLRLHKRLLAVCKDFNVSDYQAQTLTTTFFFLSSSPSSSSMLTAKQEKKTCINITSTILYVDIEV